MQRPAFLVIVALLLAGCSQNKISVENYSLGNIYLNFRAEVTTIPPYNTLTGQPGKQDITDIPNGTFPYSTTYEYPAGYTPMAGEGLTGSWAFQQGKTSVLIMYSSAFKDTVYEINATWTSTLSTSAPTQ